MSDKKMDLVIIGGGPAGMAAAVAAKEMGVENILILERDHRLGGILNQCIHNGFGLHIMKEELTGPEYADRYVSRVIQMQIPYSCDTMVVEINYDEKSGYKVVECLNSQEGFWKVHARTVVLAMGCRERSRGALNIPGYRPAGVYSAGTAQYYVNMEGRMPGKEVVILGSGDIGLIMARRMTLEGAKVKVVAEIMPYSGGLKRNIVQCLEDFQIPLKLRHTVIDIKGKERVEGVTIAEVDEKGKPVSGTEEYYSCDTLLLSCGLIPENELSRQLGVAIHPVTSGPIVNESLETTIPGVFACGNVLHVHDLVDYVSGEAEQAGKNAAKFLQDGEGRQGDSGRKVSIVPGKGIRYTVPSYIHVEQMPEKLMVRFRVDNIYRDKIVAVYEGEDLLMKSPSKVMEPGEMEQIILTKKKLLEQTNSDDLTIIIEEKQEVQK